MIREILFVAAVSTSACIVPQSVSGDTTSLKANVEKNPDKYISDNGKGIAFVKCANEGPLTGNFNDMASAVVGGCDASLTAALARFAEVIDIDPVVVDGTTAGYMVLYETKNNTPMPEVKTEPMMPTSAPAVPYNP
jgi:hypothetical protein